MSQPLDLSVLAQVAEKETVAPPGGIRTGADTPPTLPHGEQPTRREGSRPTNTGASPGSTAGARTRRTRPRPDPGTPATPDRRIVPDDEAAPVYRAGILVKPLTDLYVAVGTMLLPISPAVGTAFVQNAQPCAESLDELARTNPAVRKVLMSLLTTGAWGKVIAAHFPIILAIGVTYSPQVRASLAGEPLTPSTVNDTTETVNPVSNGYVRDNRDPRQPS